MTRLETFAAAVAVLLAVHAPLAAQTVVIDGAGDVPRAQVTVKAKPGKSTKPPKPPEEPTFRVSGGLEKTKELARESAVRAAVERVRDYLLEQEPPVRQKPTLDIVRRMILDDQDKVTEQQFQFPDSDRTETMYTVEVGVKVRPELVRELRSRERSSEGLWILAGLGGLAGVFALFFKVDAWTKGYLTSWLVLGTVGAASLVGGLWWMAK
ncbi:MAG TPA: hypothetical protein VM597_21790 [Gemmataceae bacterium]|jgi:hypothetical protein|nr:hypothetical protein [Gemmataceae bacterium]